MNKDYRIALRDDSEGYLDDVVVKDVEMFRLERMDDGLIWMCCYLKGNDNPVTFWVSGGRRTKTRPMPCMVDVTEYPKDVVYEGYKDSRHPKIDQEDTKDTENYCAVCSAPIWVASDYLPTSHVLPILDDYHTAKEQSKEHCAEYHPTKGGICRYTLENHPEGVHKDWMGNDFEHGISEKEARKIVY